VGGLAKDGQPSARRKWFARIAEAIAIGLTDEEASLLAGINPDTMTEGRKDPEFSGAIKRATAERLLMRLERIEDGLPPVRERRFGASGRSLVNVMVRQQSNRALPIRESSYG
jgi:hypothetical protein